VALRYVRVDHTRETGEPHADYYAARPLLLQHKFLPVSAVIRQLPGLEFKNIRQVTPPIDP
jgi:hypothetical protein